VKVIRFFAVFLFMSASLWAQATSQIQGVVKDSSGALIPGAEVKATQTDTSVSRTALTGADGGYVLPNLPIGPYRLEVSMGGFAKYVQTGILLTVASNLTVNVTMKIGEVTQQIEVQANASLVESQSTSVGSVIENERIVELPLNGRNAVELIQLAGAAVPGGKVGTAGMPGGLNISVSGGLLSGVTYTLDGTLYNNPFDAMNLPFPFPDALQEFKVETSALTAQNGLHSAGTVSAVVRSGTNAYHGNMFEFFRNGKLNARNSFAPRRDTLKRNQYGGTIGGPIIQNKLFFFAGYQGTKTRSDPADLIGFVPTTRMLAGDFSGCGFTQIKDPATGIAYPNNQIPVSQFSPQALAVVKLLPAAVGPCGQVPYGPVAKINEHQVLGRVDYQINDKQMLFGRYMATKYLLPPAYSFSKNILDTAGTGGGLDDLAQSGTIGHTYLFSSTTLNTLRIAANRVAVARSNNDYFSGCDIGVKMYCFVPHQVGAFTVTGGPVIGIATNIAATFVPSYYTLSDDVSMVRGSHQFAFGYSGYKYQHSQKANINSSAGFTFTGLASGLGMADFLLGKLATMNEGSPNTVFTYKWYHGLYAQDTWKVSRRLTVNMGVRWEPFLPQGLNNGAVYTFSMDRFNKGIKSAVYKNAPAGLLYAGDSGFIGNQGVANRFNQFAPRIGLAFDPKGDGKTSIRASFGMFYDYPNIQIMSNPAAAPPFGNTVTLTGPINLADPWATYPGGNPFPVPFNANAPFVKTGQFEAQQPDAKGITVYSWNLSVQRQIGKDVLLSATYMGNETAHIWGSLQLNPAVIVPCPGGAPLSTCNTTGNVNQRRVAYLANPVDGQYLGAVNQLDASGTGNYHGMLLVAQKRLSRGVSLNANYTWSHCIADLNQGSIVGGFTDGYLDPNNRRRDRANCQTATLDGTQSLDRRHIFNFTSVLESPHFSGKALNTVASNWRLSASYRSLSGAFLTPVTNLDRQLSGAAATSQRPNRILSDPLCSNPSPSCWVNPAAFAQPDLGTLGNSGRSSVLGPGTWQIDMAVSRIFKVREGMSLEARGEAFNLTNSFRAGPVTLTLNNPNFGKILTAQDPRIMQLALKFVF
jgi:hypothetical protein